MIQASRKSRITLLSRTTTDQTALTM